MEYELAPNKTTGAMRTTNNLASHVRLACAAAVTAWALTIAVPATAQPWVPAQGEGSVSLLYQNYYTLGHYDLLGHPNTNGATHNKALALEIDYGLTDTIGFVIDIPFIASKYTGPPSYFVAGIQTFPGPLDDGTYHGAIQDFRIEMRRLFMAGPVALTPFVGGTAPSHEYETKGEAVPGRGRPELQLGASVGLPLDQLLPAAYTHVRYGLAASPPEDGHSAVRSLIDLAAGVHVLPRVGASGIFAWQIRNKGPLAPELADDWANHDRFIVGNFFNAGAELTFVFTRSMDVSATWMQTMAGKNGAHRARLFTVGVTWSLGAGFSGFGP
jgi:hypothetical protein